MSKKGFTLIELLIIIGLLALMVGVFSINMTRILNRTNTSTEEEAYTELIAAADVYLAINKNKLYPLYNGNSEITIKIKDLKNEGLIAEEYSINGKIVNNNTAITVTLGKQKELVFNIEMSGN